MRMWKNWNPHTVIAGGNVKWCSCCGKQFGISSKRYINIELYDPAILPLGRIKKKLKNRDSNRYLYTNILGSII